MLTSTVLPFQEVKSGNNRCECDDAYYFDERSFRYVVADGATDSYDSGRWAALVSRHVGETGWTSDIGRFIEQIPALGEKWVREIDLQSLPWYKVQKAEMGAACTLLGLTLFPLPEDVSEEQAELMKWSAIAIGDSCLFQLREGRSEGFPIPITHAEAFGTTPPLIHTWATNLEESAGAVAFAGGSFRPGDLFLLATDALAHFFIERLTEGTDPWSDVLAIKTEGQFSAWLDGLREKKLIRNDDVTLLIVETKIDKSNNFDMPINEAISVSGFGGFGGVAKVPRDRVVRGNDEPADQNVLCREFCGAVFGFCRIGFDRTSGLVLRAIQRSPLHRALNRRGRYTPSR